METWTLYYNLDGFVDTHTRKSKFSTVWSCIGKTKNRRLLYRFGALKYFQERFCVRFSSPFRFHRLLFLSHGVGHRSGAAHIKRFTTGIWQQVHRDRDPPCIRCCSRCSNPGGPRTVGRAGVNFHPPNACAVRAHWNMLHYVVQNIYSVRGVGSKELSFCPRAGLS